MALGRLAVLSCRDPFPPPVMERCLEFRGEIHRGGPEGGGEVRWHAHKRSYIVVCHHVLLCALTHACLCAIPRVRSVSVLLHRRTTHNRFWFRVLGFWSPQVCKITWSVHSPVREGSFPEFPAHNSSFCGVLGSGVRVQPEMDVPGHAKSWSGFWGRWGGEVEMISVRSLI